MNFAVVLEIVNVTARHHGWTIPFLTRMAIAWGATGLSRDDTIEALRNAFKAHGFGL